MTKENALPIRMTAKFKARLFDAAKAAGEENVSTWVRKVFRRALERPGKRLRAYSPVEAMSETLYVKLEKTMVVEIVDVCSDLEVDIVKWARAILAREIGCWS